MPESYLFFRVNKEVPCPPHLSYWRSLKQISHVLLTSSPAAVALVMGNKKRQHPALFGDVWTINPWKSWNHTIKPTKSPNPNCSARCFLHQGRFLSDMASISAQDIASAGTGVRPQGAQVLMVGVATSEAMEHYIRYQLVVLGVLPEN